VGGEKQVPFDFAQGRLSRDTAALGMTKFFWALSPDVWRGLLSSCQSAIINI
jgi:hypothetical protein